VPASILEAIPNSESVSYSTLRKRLLKNGLQQDSRATNFYSSHGKAGLMSEEIDLLR